jgi:serine/threonine protein kinase
VAEQGPLPAWSVRRLAAGLAEGLSAIHAAGVVHRDLKPSNVLLTQDGPRVIDFGISQAVWGAEAGALTRTGLVVGSPGFMSPEQAEGREIGPPSDIFSLGAVLAFAATGKGPFGGGSTPALVYRVVCQPASLDDVPAEVRALIERCLAKHPGERPTARDILAGAGAVTSAADWLPAQVTRTVVQLPTPADPARTVTSAKLAASSEPITGQLGRHGDRRRRGRLGRPLAIAAMVAGLLAASAARGIALTASAHQSAHRHSGQAASGPTTPAAPRVSQTSAVAPSTSPSAIMSPTVTPSATMSPIASPSPTATPSASMSPAATPSASMSPAAAGSSAPAAS